MVAEGGTPTMLRTSPSTSAEDVGSVVGQTAFCTGTASGSLYVSLEPAEGRNFLLLKCGPDTVLIPSADVFTRNFCSVLSSIQVCMREGPDYRGTDIFEGFSSSWWEGDPTRPHEGMKLSIPSGAFPLQGKKFELGCMGPRKKVCRVVVSTKGQSQALRDPAEGSTSAAVYAPRAGWSTGAAAAVFGLVVAPALLP